MPNHWGHKQGHSVYHVLLFQVAATMKERTAGQDGSLQGGMILEKTHYIKFTMLMLT